MAGAYILILIYLWYGSFYLLCAGTTILILLDAYLEMLFPMQVARILLFIYAFYHVYLHFDQVMSSAMTFLVTTYTYTSIMLELLTWPQALCSTVRFLRSFFISEQVKQMHDFGKLLIFGVPLVLFVMNLMWFGKILKGLRKTLAKRQ